jgi:hypothetical protein
MVTPLPNTEALVSAFLRSHDDVDALVGDRVYTALPKDVTYPAVRVTQYYSQHVTQRPLWVVRNLLQVDCWGGSKIDAWRLASTVQAAMAEDLEGDHDHGVVCGVTFDGMVDQPDQDHEPARPRFFFTCAVTAHPLRVGAS